MKPYRTISNRLERLAALVAAIISATVLGFGTNALAGTDTWTGGGNDNLWGTGANWGGTAPSLGDVIQFASSTLVMGKRVEVRREVG